MTTMVGWVIDGNRVCHALQQASEKLDGADAEVVLDFSAVRRLDPAAIAAVEELARMADRKQVKIALRGVSIDVYRVLKLSRLAPRFAFI